MSSKSTKKSTGLNDPDDCLDDDRGRQRAIVGSNGDDKGRDHRPVVAAPNGNDTLTGTDGADTIIGRNGNDTIIGRNGNDTIYGRAGNDNIDGGKGNDAIFGDEGNDRLNGGQGDDTLTGGAGNDYIDGGPHGYDVAVFSGNHGEYTITYSAGPLDSEGYKITVVDSDPSRDGTDTLRRVDVLVFADGEYKDGQFTYYNASPVLSDTTNPAAVDEAGDSSTQDLAAISGSFALSDLDVGDTLTASVVGDPTVRLNGGTFALPAGATALTAAGAFSISPPTQISNGGATSIVYTYNPGAANLDFLGAGQSLTVTYQVKVYDGTVDSGMQDVTFTIIGTNDTPVLTGDLAATIAEGGSYALTTADLGYTDSDDAAADVTFTVSAPANGTVKVGGVTATTFTGAQLAAGQVSFAHDGGETATASFEVSVEDGNEDASTPVVSTFDLTVTAVNDVPDAVNDEATVLEGGSVTTVNVLTNDTDTDTALTAAMITGFGQGTHGTVQNNSDGTFTYVHDGSDGTTDSFTYTINDGAGGSDTATVNVNVTPVNDAPVLNDTTNPAAVDEAGDSSAQDLVAITGSFALNDQDIYDTLTASVVGNPTVLLNGNAFTLPVGASALTAGAFSISPSSQTSNGGAATAIGYTYDPVAANLDFLSEGQNLTVTYQVQVNDGTVDSTTQDVTFTITGTNDRPELTVPAIIDVDTTRPDAGREVVGYLSTDDKDDGATQTYSVADGVSTSHGDYDLMRAGTFGTLYLNSTTGKYSYTYEAATDALDIGGAGDEDFSITVSDLDAQTTGHALTDTKSLTVHLDGTNDATVITGVMPFNYTIDDPAKVVAPELKLTDPDSDRVTSASVWVSKGFTANDLLSFPDTFILPAGVTAVYDGNSGILTITGTGTLAEYQGILDSVTFHATAQGFGGRTIAFQVFDQVLGRPLVESAIRETDNLSLLDLTTSVLRLPGVAPGDLSGFSASAAGDVNHDGYADLIIGATFADIDGDITGSSYVVYGKAEDFGGELPLADLNGTNGFAISGINVYDRTGFSVRDAGDVNGDGFSDVIIGAPYANSQGETSGTSQFGGSYVVFGGPANSAATMSLASLNGSNGFAVIGAGTANWAGYSASGAGDVNGDGFADVIIGAPTASTIPGDERGAAYVLFGHDSQATPFAQNLDLAQITTAQGFVMIGASAGDWTGASVSAAGDMNGDGIGDLIIGNATPEGVSASATGYVVFGNAAGFGASVNLSTLSGTNGFRFHGAGAGNAGPANAHYAVRSAGDVNGDGFGDVIIGAPYASTDHGTSGAAYVVFGHSPTTPFGDLNLQNLNGTAGFKLIGVADGDRAGYSVSGAGDVNGDGYGDLIIGAPSAQQNDSPAGTSYLIFGKGSGFGTIDLANMGNGGFRISAAAPRNDSGYAVSAAGDLNGDGFDDVLVSSSSASPHTREYAGESYVIFGSKFIVADYTQVGVPVPVGTPTSLVGSAADDVLISGQSGDTTMFGNGGVDSFSGGAGNDTIHLGVSGSNDSRFLKIDGGGESDTVVIEGFDTLVFDGSGMVLDLTAAGVSGRIHNIERIDLSGSGDNTIKLDMRDVLNMDDNSNRLLVSGNLGDSVKVNVDAGWALGETPTIDSVTYDTYKQGPAELLIDQELTVQLTVHFHGTTASDTFIGSLYDTVMYGNGGVDSFTGGVGDDTMHLGLAGAAASSFLEIDGGGGFDTLVFDGSGMELNLTATGVSERIHNIERIDLSGSGSNTLKLDVLDLLNMDDNSNRLLVDGDAANALSGRDSVEVKIGEGWTLGAVQEVIGGVTYDAYTQGIASLFIDHDLSVTFTI